MNLTADDIRAIILNHIGDGLRAKGIEATAVADDFDFLQEGVIDSFGFLELIVVLEERVGHEIDFSDLPPEELTVLVSLSSYVAARASSSTT